MAAKQKLHEIKDKTVVFVYDDNPNIPTTSYNEETKKRIERKIAEKMKEEALKKIMAQNLKTKKTKSTDGEILDLTFQIGDNI
jgi:phosphoribosyl-ATP pyrophosphohydrolase